jgi:hypothetical protein
MFNATILLVSVLEEVKANVRLKITDAYLPLIKT